MSKRRKTDDASMAAAAATAVAAAPQLDDASLEQTIQLEAAMQLGRDAAKEIDASIPAVSTDEQSKVMAYMELGQALRRLKADYDDGDYQAYCRSLPKSINSTRRSRALKIARHGSKLGWDKAKWQTATLDPTIKAINKLIGKPQRLLTIKQAITRVKALQDGVALLKKSAAKWDRKEAEKAGLKAYLPALPAPEAPAAPPILDV